MENTLHLKRKILNLIADLEIKDDKISLENTKSMINFIKFLNATKGGNIDDRWIYMDRSNDDAIEKEIYGELRKDLKLKNNVEKQFSNEFIIRITEEIKVIFLTEKYEKIDDYDNYLHMFYVKKFGYFCLKLKLYESKLKVMCWRLPKIMEEHYLAVFDEDGNMRECDDCEEKYEQIMKGRKFF